MTGILRPPHHPPPSGGGPAPGAPAAPGAPGVPGAPMPDAPGPDAPASVPRQRDAYFDNVKFFLILLVVLGHVWEVFRKDSQAADAAYTVVYAFHMPLFVFVSGYFSRGFMRSTSRFRGIFPTLIVPFAIFNVAYRLLAFVNADDFRLHELFRPQFLMWFLVALALWRLSAPLWAHLRYPVATAVVLSLIAGSWSFNSDPTICRAAGLLPFFVLGLTIRSGNSPDGGGTGPVEALRSRDWTRWAGASALVAALPIAYVWERGTVVPKIEHGVRLWNRGYEQMGFSMPEGMSYRLLAMVFALVLGAAFLAVVPRGRAWYTRLGTRTMYVYLLHGLVVKALQYGGVLDDRFFRSPPGLVLVTAGGLALGVLLAATPVVRLTRWAVEPKARWLLKPSQGAT
ncbi:acyltransferase family protein [Actinomadura sp. 9N215]|uniref:acyltransferase family protein n=1 Tax=Actinomadura sp. 9N215 TaxID=3375150 RepID=UPI00379D431D